MLAGYSGTPLPKKLMIRAGATDVSGTRVRARGLAAGIVDYKVAAIDATWSGLAFA